MSEPTLMGVLFVLTIGSFSYTFLKTNKQATKDDMKRVEDSVTRVGERVDCIYDYLLNGKGKHLRKKEGKCK